MSKMELVEGKEIHIEKPQKYEACGDDSYWLSAGHFLHLVMLLGSLLL